ncbi:MAG: hypothetical protein HY718_01110 [Planctomycetes bacterium]|nr:hypothetical protein [Planctomycetota bacterium]
MKANPRFLNQPKDFWANVRSISQHIGYTKRGTGQILVPQLPAMAEAMRNIGLGTSHLVTKRGQPTPMGRALSEYFEYRAHTLNTMVAPCLMDADQARRTFEKLKKTLCPRCPLPMNKQKGKKKAPAYLTGIINMLIEANAEEFSCDYDPRQLTTFTRDAAPLRTLARRVDGAFPSVVNPVAVWEVKEYYYTTTFGSRVADGVYESLLDGMELEELREVTGLGARHYLMADARYTWWDRGRSYLCRVIDMLHMGYVDEVLFGTQVIDRMPTLVKEWVQLARRGGLRST